MSMNRTLHLGCGERLSSPCLDVLASRRPTLKGGGEVCADTLERSPEVRLPEVPDPRRADPGKVG